MSVEAINVFRSYGTVRALEDVSFSLVQGEVAALLGPNGAGKSTMMKIITCFIPQHAGQVKVCGFDVLEQPLEARKRIGYLPENNPLYHDMYVGEYLIFVAGLYKLTDIAKRVARVCEVTGLQSEMKKKIGALSKGYRQRVGLAQALVHDPEVLILDEPTSGLDPNQLAEIRQVIKDIGKKKTVLLSTHIMQEVEAICDRVIIINKGKIVADAPTAELQLLNRGNHIIRITYDREASLQALKSLPGVSDVAGAGNHSYRVFCSRDHDVRPDLFQYAVSNGLVILGMELETQSLEQVFRQFTE